MAESMFKDLLVQKTDSSHRRMNGAQKNALMLSALQETSLRNACQAHQHVNLMGKRGHVESSELRREQNSDVGIVFHDRYSCEVHDNSRHQKSCRNSGNTVTRTHHSPTGRNKLWSVCLGRSSPALTCLLATMYTVYGVAIVLSIHLKIGELANSLLVLTLLALIAVLTGTLVLFCFRTPSSSTLSGHSMSHAFRLLQLCLTSGTLYALSKIAYCVGIKTTASQDVVCNPSTTLFDATTAGIYEMTFIVGGVGFASALPTQTWPKVVAWVTVVLASILRLHGLVSIGRAATAAHVTAANAALPV